MQEWLSHYKPHELFTSGGDVIDEIKSVIPEENSKKLGQRPEAYKCYVRPELPNWEKFGVKKGDTASAMKSVGRFIDQVFINNPHSVRMFSPDELESNKLDAVFDHTGRNFQWDEFSNARGGRVIEVLSEHLCQGFMQGYTLTGRVALFPSYESFLGIIHTMMVQYAKFNKMVGPVPSSFYHFSFAHTNPDRRVRQNGTNRSAASTTSKPVPGPVRNTTASPTRTHRSSAQC